ncbi:ABC transporter substrate-binding protein [Mycobacterium sp. NAZ190054]|uniref:ABC transporter substrate-binding protein n=1 Tax=Mycobacterium sp. NAZ190054 TaxID=1747766 RepID=UPI0018D250EA|nr:extracellular solute-binding protein [Mycobacterium sp. NAZ190054]
MQDKVKGMPPQEREATLVEEAKNTNDGTINLYTEVNDPTVITDPFEEKYGDLTVSVYRAGSEQIRERVLQEASANFAGADIIELDSLEMAIVDDNKLLAPADSPYLDGVTESAKFDNFTGDRLSYIVPVWNTTIIPDAEAPQSFEALADPRFRGKLALEGSDVFWFASMVNHLQTQGMTKDEAVQLFKDIAANSAITDGHTTTTDLVVAGQYGIAANNYIHRIRELQGKGAPLEFVPVKVPVVAEVTGIAVPCASANPAGALLLQDFILGPEGQQAFIDDDRTPSNEQMAAASFGGVEIEPIDTDVEEISKEYSSWSELWQSVIHSGGQG